MSEFQFSYQSLKVSVRLEGDDTLCVRMGLRSWRVPLSQLRQFYVMEQSMVGGRELILRHGAEDKAQCVKVYADAGQAGFGELVDWLAQRVPSADIRQMDKAEALALMKTGDSMRSSAFALAGLLAAAIVGGGLWAQRQAQIGGVELAIGVAVGLAVVAGMLVYTLRQGSAKT